MITRREFSKSVLAGGTAMLASADLLSASTLPDSQAAAQAKSLDKSYEGTGGADKKYDLLIKGGTVIDPAQNMHGLFDVAINNGKIITVAPDIPEDQARDVFSAKDRIVTPGMIDIHVHCNYGVDVSVNADHYCLGRGTTTCVDAGSTGYVAIRRFVMDIVNTSITRVYALVHIGAIGAETGLPRAMENLAWEDPALCAKAVINNRPSVIGVKVHLSKERSSNPKDNELVFLKNGIEAGEMTHLPVMVHINNTYNPLPVILNKLRKGDIFTHCFNAFPQDSPLDKNGKLLPEVLDARARGVVFDIAAGSAHPHFSFDVADKCLQQGFLPDTISTDLDGPHVAGTDLPILVSKFLALGMKIDKAIELTTINPSKVFDFGVPIGTLKPGSEADIGIFELREGKFEFVDGIGAKRTGTQKLINTAAVCRGGLFVNQI
jgi:dihydroorotase